MTSPSAPDAQPCENCPGPPEGAPQPPQAVPVDVTRINSPVEPESLYPLRWLFYNGGPPEAIFIRLSHVIPAEYDRVTVNVDGSLEYKSGLDGWEPPSPIDGYERAPENPLLFRPRWKSCQHRLFSVAVKPQCQCVAVVAKCIRSIQYVKCKECDECASRAAIPPYNPPQKKTLSSLRQPDLGRSSN